MAEKKRAVFLDRDGVLNKSLGRRPPNNPEELVLFPGVPEAVARLNEAGLLTFVVTNQGGVALGYMTPEELDKIHNRLAEEVVKAEAFLQRLWLHPPPRAAAPAASPSPACFWLWRRNTMWI